MSAARRSGAPGRRPRRAGRRAPLELGVVTQVYTNEGGSGDTNLAVNVRLRGSALELQRVPVAVGRLGLSVGPARRRSRRARLRRRRPQRRRSCSASSTTSRTARPTPRRTRSSTRCPTTRRGFRRIELQLPNGNKLTARGQSVTITMGGTTLTVEADGAITLEAAGDITLSSKGCIERQGGRLDQPRREEHGERQGAVAHSVEATGQATLKGATTTIAGMTSFSPG